MGTYFEGVFDVFWRMPAINLQHYLTWWTLNTWINTLGTAAQAHRAVSILPEKQCLTRVSPIEVIKGQTWRSWELPSQSSCVITISEPGLRQDAAFGVNELKREGEDSEWHHNYAN